METIKRYRRYRRYSLPIVGVVLILGALLVNSLLTSASAAGASNGWGWGRQAAGQNDCLGGTQGGAGMMGGGMMGGGMMGGSMGGMMADVDRRFIEQMIPHHEDAIAMADLALQKAKRPEIKKLATDIKRVQQAEIDQMRAWYKQWFGTDVPTHNDSDQGMMGSGSGGMMGGGMGMGMGLDDLANAADFDKAFINMMVPHHRMALMMSNMVLRNGGRAELQTLARSIITSQSTEIEQMQTWYRQWYGTGAPTP